MKTSKGSRHGEVIGKWVANNAARSTIFRVKWDREKPISPLVVSETGLIQPIPEFGAIGFNIRLPVGEIRLVAYELVDVTTIEGVALNLRVDVSQGDDFPPKSSPTAQESLPMAEESFYGSTSSCTSEELISFAQKVLEADEGHLQQLATTANAPIHSAKLMDTKFPSHQANVAAAGRSLLKQQYPLFFRAYERVERATNDKERGVWRNKARAAFIAESMAAARRPPNAENETALYKDEYFWECLRDAAARKNRKLNPIDWELFRGWLSSGYYQMRPDELSKAIEKAIGSQCTGQMLQKRAQRLGLISAVPLGRKELHPFQNSE